ncbi:hypothetical protein ASF73_11215 [Xanthomonas sp. Leaf131]|nr:hypothetical protein ASF73_11215 [Xanthomonas sp. Leaf131]
MRAAALQTPLLPLHMAVTATLGELAERSRTQRRFVFCCAASSLRALAAARIDMIAVDSARWQRSCHATSAVAPSRRDTPA